MSVKTTQTYKLLLVLIVQIRLNLKSRYIIKCNFIK